MKIYAVIMLGGALGSGLRYTLANWIDARFNPALPWGTITVNIVGCFVIGLFVGLIEGSSTISPLWKAFVTIGILGGFTTFSSFSLQTIMLWQNGAWLFALLNVLISVAACLVATTAGFALAGLIKT